MDGDNRVLLLYNEDQLEHQLIKEGPNMDQMHTRQRLVITVSDAPGTDSKRVVSELTSMGFECIEHLEAINCLLGEFAGDPDELMKIKGVSAVEQEGTMYSQ